MHRLSMLFLSFSLPISLMASPVVLEENAQESNQQKVAKRYIGLAHAYDVRVRKEAALCAVAKRYVGFLEQFGAQDQGNVKELMGSLFASDCQKIVNGKTITHTVDELYNQMAKAKEVVGTWSVNIVNPVMVNTETNTVVIHYEILTQEAGTFVVMKFLTVDNGLVTEINEVYNALDNIVESLHQIVE
jgi:hypothetical protein